MRVGSLFSGYGGLDRAVGGEVVWYSDIEPAACSVLAEHHPGVPNLGDIKKVDWSKVEPVDVLTGGYPCQPFSTAGVRKGADDERHLFPYVQSAIESLRPSWVVLENVRGHLTLGFRDVLSALHDVGYDARWGVVRASDAGAPHRRERVFIVATPHTGLVAGASSESRRDRADGSGGRSGSSDARHSDTAHPHGAGLQGAGSRSSALPKWCATDGHTASCSEDASSYSSRGISDEHSAGHGASDCSEPSGFGEEVGLLSTRGDHSAFAWDRFGSAIYQWESVLGRSAPDPAVWRTDRWRLNPMFVEWLMGLPEGHVTGRGLSVAQELKLLGNGVVPQQARLALDLLGVPRWTAA